MTTTSENRQSDPEEINDPIPRGPLNKGSDQADGSNKTSTLRRIGKGLAIAFIALVGVLLPLSLISPEVPPAN